LNSGGLFSGSSPLAGAPPVPVKRGGSGHLLLAYAISVSAVQDDVEVHVIDMEGMGARIEHGGKPSACRRPDRTDHISRVIIPFRIQANRFAIRKLKTFDIHGLAQSMLAAPAWRIGS
jgi:hypothetical protein